MSNIHYWDEALKRYATKDWANKPTLFAEQIQQYLPHSGKILELGSGQGQDALCFAKQGYDVTATDLVDTGLKECELKARSQDISLNFQLVDIGQALPFEDESFDIVYSHLGLHYLNKQGTEKLFQEIHRILKPGGILASLFNTVEDPEMSSSGFEKIEENYYREIAFDFYKRFFSVQETSKFIQNLFEPILLDNQGETYKDEIKTLIRLVAKKI
jgi:SAM-dependent methyltransferase